MANKWVKNIKLDSEGYKNYEKAMRRYMRLHPDAVKTPHDYELIKEVLKVYVYGDQSANSDTGNGTGSAQDETGPGDGAISAKSV